jgi:hypothetical protein
MSKAYLASRLLRIVGDYAADTLVELLKRVFRQPNVQDQDWLVETFGLTTTPYLFSPGLLLRTASACGEVVSIERIIDRFDVKQIPTDVFSVACSHGHLQIMKWYDSQRKLGKTTNQELPDTIQNEVKQMCSRGHMMAFRWWLANSLFANYAGQGSFICELYQRSVWESGNVEFMDWFAKRFNMSPADLVRLLPWTARCPLDDFLKTIKLAESNDVHLSAYNIRETWEKACACGNQDVAKWISIHHPFQQRGKYGFLSALRHGQLDMAKWLHGSFDIKNAGYHTGMACRGGNVGLVKWLRDERREEWSDRCLIMACASGNQDMVKFVADEYKTMPRSTVLMIFGFKETFAAIPSKRTRECSLNYLVERFKVSGKEIGLQPFESACQALDLSRAKWLADTFPNVHDRKSVIDKTWTRLDRGKLHTEVQGRFFQRW